MLFFLVLFARSFGVFVLVFSVLFVLSLKFRHPFLTLALLLYQVLFRIHQLHLCYCFPFLLLYVVVNDKFARLFDFVVLNFSLICLSNIPFCCPVSNSIASEPSKKLP